MTGIISTAVTHLHQSCGVCIIHMRHKVTFIQEQLQRTENRMTDNRFKRISLLLVIEWSFVWHIP